MDHAKPCPSCGHCPTCGRGGYFTRPWYPDPWWRNTTTGGSTTIPASGTNITWDRPNFTIAFDDPIGGNCPEGHAKLHEAMGGSTRG